MNIQSLTAVLAAVIALETSYLTYRAYRGQVTAKNTSIFVDTSVLMDGRVLEVATAGFIPGTLVIPRSVIGELQLLADGSDSERRERARRGLDVVRRLQDTANIDVSILADSSRAPEGVDERLLSLAKKYGGKLLTIDYNLNKVAQVEDIIVLNINDLAKQLRMSYLPGDTLAIDLTQPGSDSHQAIGHLDDGTMVVVEHAKQSLGKRVEIEVIRSLQTSAGRMMFAKLTGKDKVQEAQPKKLQGLGRKQITKPVRQEIPTGKSVHQKRDNKVSKQSSSQQSTKPRTAKQHEASLVDLANR